ncbi:MAG TPA: excinuclease ABC subunit UvrA [Candidatus Marinimicrobia bacterium]|nr:excinuclease ABC subunit UvrA [Candidatus Neomarinimicrobiota bacterium]HRS51019.1 excinuclease ABC subunit UvrA [Candidatus Neomarinimicrobiota bacterium]HRU92526.1 excinuclease ABC subunit UvrA [Candidatus Neomarinimicrobiota bacterium]
MNTEYIVIKGAREHNLKNIDVKIPRDKFVVITGLSGSGKSSLAFDTIYAEGQRRYVESLSAYARQFLGLMEKPDVDFIEGLSPAISIEQKSSSRNPRSTVGTVTEIYDYLRLLYARIGIPYCYQCGKRIERQTAQQIVDNMLSWPEDTRLTILAPLVRGRKGEYREVFREVRREGFLRVRIDGKIYEIEHTPILDKNKKHNIEVVIDRLSLNPTVKDRLTESVELALKIGSGLLAVVINSENEQIFSEKLACTDCGISYEELEPRMFSFNSPYGACPTCDGLGTLMEIDPALIVPDESKTLSQGAIIPLGEQPRGGWYSAILKGLARKYNFDFVTPFKKLPQEAKNALLYGSEGTNLSINLKSDRINGEYHTTFEGVIPNLRRRYKQTTSTGIRMWIQQFMGFHLCPQCQGARLKPESLAIKVGGFAINQLSAMSITKLKDFFDNLELNPTEQQIAHQILKEIRTRLNFLIDVGVEYLTLDRMTHTLSGGEAQRIRLATQIGSQLMGVLYILDEPSIGLHQRDNRRLIETLLHLRDNGNTVIVVEHDREMIESADYIVDLGPGAGATGGNVVFAGTPAEIKNEPRSLTGQYLSGAKTIPIPRNRRPGNAKQICLLGATGNNLKNIDVGFPLNKFICITGVSGSGKSTLINETLFPILHRYFYGSQKTPLKYSDIKGLEYIDKVIAIDQSPIGRTPRSNPATYTGTFTHIRDLFANLKESKIRGYTAGRFSFNVRGGRCETCGGDGIKKIEMHFLPDVYVLCEECKGLRYNRDTLEVKYKGKSIADVLNMSVSEAFEFFRNIPSINKKLQTLIDVGLGYIKLGQQATTLSGGEAQRVKLSTELSKVGTGKTLYILDEPTTGLHFDDIKMLLNVLNRLVDQGNTVIVIEHNLDVIKTADYIIDLGPEGGEKGGYIVCEGTPEEVSFHPTSQTGKFLAKIL